MCKGLRLRQHVRGSLHTRPPVRCPEPRARQHDERDGQRDLEYGQLDGLGRCHLHQPRWWWGQERRPGVRDGEAVQHDGRAGHVLYRLCVPAVRNIRAEGGGGLVALLGSLARGNREERSLLKFFAGGAPRDWLGVGTVARGGEP